MIVLAAVAAVFTTINGIIGAFNGLPTLGGQARKVLSDKGKTEGEKKVKKYITYLRWVKQKVQEEATHRINSKCSETSITADLKPLHGELEEAWSLVRDWQNKNGWVKRWASKKFAEKWEKSEKAIGRRLQEFSSYTRGYEAMQHINQATKPTTQHIDRAAKFMHVENLTLRNCTLNLNQGYIPIQPYNEHPSRMGKEQWASISDGEEESESITDGEREQWTSITDGEGESITNGEGESPSSHHRTQEKVDKGHNRKSQGFRETREAHPS